MGVTSTYCRSMTHLLPAYWRKTPYIFPMRLAKKGSHVLELMYYHQCSYACKSVIYYHPSHSDVFFKDSTYDWMGSWKNSSRRRRSREMEWAVCSSDQFTKTTFPFFTPKRVDLEDDLQTLSSRINFRVVSWYMQHKLTFLLLTNGDCTYGFSIAEYRERGSEIQLFDGKRRLNDQHSERSDTRILTSER